MLKFFGALSFMLEEAGVLDYEACGYRVVGLQA